MIKISNIIMPLDSDLSTEGLVKKAMSILKLNPQKQQIEKLFLASKAVDARKGQVKFVCAVVCQTNCNEKELVERLADKNISLFNEYQYQNKTISPKFIEANKIESPVIIGFGPAGIFAGLTLAQAGLKPIIVEQGQTVDEREKTVDSFWKNGTIDKFSNVQFGEGGAGLFSDGKLNTGTKNERCAYVLKTFYQNGASEEILYSNKAHIGTDKLKIVCKNIREQIINLGGTFLFQTKLIDVETENKNGQRNIRAVNLENVKTGEQIKICSQNILLAIGHSSRDLYRYFKSIDVQMCQKDFSIGVRIEHLQQDINKSQYGHMFNHEALKNADYKLFYHLPNGRCVYTFCMCPGGVVVASSSNSGEVVTNGMSYYARNGKNANSALLVNVTKQDLKSDDVLAGVEFQSEYEKRAFSVSNSFKAPCQKVGDFLNGKKSTSFGKVKPSYLPGVELGSVESCLPRFAVESLKQALPVLDRKLKGFADNDAILTGVETRTSSPLRILRDENFQSNIKGIFPCGEGAGYAGGIMSACVDGMLCAEAIINKIQNKL